MPEYLKNEVLTISYNEAALAVVAKWIVTPTSAEFREGLDAMLAAMKKFDTGKLVVDTTFLGAIHPDDQQWSANDWYKKAREVGYNQIALIVPTDIFTKMSVQDTMDSVQEQAVNTGYFDNIDSAVEWIMR